jgi:hypothetical protein
MPRQSQVANKKLSGGIIVLSEKWASTLYDWANIGLIASLVVGVISTFLIVRMGNLKESYMRKEIAETNERAAHADERAAEANEIAEKERLARIKIEERLADRSLTDAQAATIIETLKPFAGQEFEVTPYADNRESKSIADRIGQVLSQANWRFLPQEFYRAMLGGVTGVIVYIHPNADIQTKNAASSLVRVLNQENIVTELREQSTENNPKHNKIEVNVGTKR